MEKETILLIDVRWAAGCNGHEGLIDKAYRLVRI